MEVVITNKIYRDLNLQIRRMTLCNIKEHFTRPYNIKFNLNLYANLPEHIFNYILHNPNNNYNTNMHVILYF